jgi:hypothetical protein
VRDPAQGRVVESVSRICSAFQNADETIDIIMMLSSQNS